LLEAILAAIFSSGGDVTTKSILGQLKVGFKNYLPLCFLMLAIISLLFVPAGFYFHAPQAFSVSSIIISIIMILAAVTYNVLLAQSLETEPLHEYEVIVLLSPLITVILAGIFLPAERNLFTFLIGIVASVVLVASRFHEDHFVVSMAAKRTMLAVVLIGIEAVCTKILLEFYSPALFYFLRVTILTIIFIICYKPDFSILKKISVLKIFILSSFCGVATMVLRYYAYKNIGLVPTTIILLLAPMLTYFASYFYFQERRNFRRDLICAIAITACIIVTLVYK